MNSNTFAALSSFTKKSNKLLPSNRGNGNKLKSISIRLSEKKILKIIPKELQKPVLVAAVIPEKFTDSGG